MNTGRNCKQTACLCRDTGGKGMLPAQHTTFNTLDNWAIKPPPTQKGKGPERKGYRVMAWNMYTIHSVTSLIVLYCTGHVSVSKQRKIKICFEHELYGPLHMFPPCHWVLHATNRPWRASPRVTDPSRWDSRWDEYCIKKIKSQKWMTASILKQNPNT